ncbi:exosortase system-associated protein, TIGR04073 family [Nitrosomonas sp. Nm166]|uniref:exosortase system-associated protein, TIGR04073 family n=1 Tax=Nitrosomonas sp. Nm166 TaxID=1881054 RepID=UPI0008F11CDD|nr:exosortase system-associated protein, TIGR04073 family [Nitrosomonas sp. Nm166]SFF09220.1 putative exosortase-associated protein, TIGR04073 family [Nitrosomonas sp. Nm166]
MRTITRLALIVFLLSLFSSQAQATEEITSRIYFNRAGMKILSGVANLTTGWMELPKNIILWRQKEENVLIKFIEGVMMGVFHTASRTASGAADLVTFWLPTFPSPNPAFIWEDFSQESEYFGWRMGR